MDELLAKIAERGLHFDRLMQVSYANGNESRNDAWECSLRDKGKWFSGAGKTAYNAVNSAYLSSIADMQTQPLAPVSIEDLL